MPQYRAFLQNLPSLDVEVAYRYWALFGIDVAPFADPTAELSDVAYFHPALKLTQCGEQAALVLGYYDNKVKNLKISFRTSLAGKYKQSDLLIPKADVQPDPLLPPYFFKIGGDLILSHFIWSPLDFAPPYLGREPNTLDMTVIGSCYDQPFPQMAAIP